jgi:hypothetical protein
VPGRRNTHFRHIANAFTLAVIPKKTMRLLIVLTLFSILSSCEFSTFSQADSDKLVTLTQEDINLYNNLKDEILSDLIRIREEMRPSNFNADTTYLSTNSYYLYQIDKSKYEPIISKLKRKNIFVDDINTRYDGMLEFRLKESIDQRDLPHFRYTHSLVFNSEETYAPYSGISEVLKDSTINKDWKYIYYKVQVGH